MSLLAKVDNDRLRLQAELQKLGDVVAAQTNQLVKKDEDIAFLKGQIKIGKHTYIRTLLFRHINICFTYVL
jgi:hypothetical protein